MTGPAPTSRQTLLARSRLLAYGAAAGGPLLLTLLVVAIPAWPKPYSWQYLGIAVAIAIVAGIRPGLVALGVATACVLWLGVPTPVHPGVEMFVAIDLCLLALLHRWRRAQQQLADALTEEDRRKDEFIAILSHELRNPLAPIRYAMPVLRGERLSGAGERAVEVIDRQVAHLAGLIDDLLDVSRITRDKMELLRNRSAGSEGGEGGEGGGKGLPVASAGPGERHLPASRPPSRLKVLVVDDNADLVEMLALVVESAGHDVRKAFDGHAGLSTALAYRPDVVLLDLGMPGMNGIEVARELRGHPETARARLIALTGWGQAEDRARTRGVGFDHHLTKPTEPETVERLLEEIARRDPM